MHGIWMASGEVACVLSVLNMVERALTQPRISSKLRRTARMPLDVATFTQHQSGAVSGCSAVAMMVGEQRACTNSAWLAAIPSHICCIRCVIALGCMACQMSPCLFECISCHRKEVVSLGLT